MNELQTVLKALRKQAYIEGLIALPMELVDSEEPFGHGRSPEVESRESGTVLESGRVELGVEFEKEGELFLNYKKIT